MTANPVYLGVDAGTTNIKLVLYSEKLEVIGSASRNTVIYMPENGASEINMEELFKSFCDASRELKQRFPEEMSRLECLGIAGQGDGFWPLDREGKPLCNAVLWNDTRSKVLNIEAIPGLEELLRDNCLNMIYAASRPAIQKWLKTYHRDLYDRLGYSLHCKDWLNYCLTGRIVSDYTDIITSSAMNFRKLEYVPELFKLLDIEEAYGTMPEVVEPLSIIGEVTASASEKTGIPAGTKVIGGCLDACAAAMGNSFYHHGEGCCVLGTAMICELCQTAEQVNPDDLRGELLYHIIPNHYIKIMNTAGGSSCADFVRELVAPEISYDEMFEKIAGVPIGSNGLIYLPYLYGERAPFKNPSACGSFTGLRSYHTRFDMLRAAYEGLAMMLRDCYEALGKIKVLYLSGGASKSPFVCQLFADALGVKVVKSANNEAGTLGIARMIKVATGAATDFSAFEMEEFTEYEPDPEKFKPYDELYSKFISVRDSLAPHWV